MSNIHDDIDKIVQRNLGKRLRRLTRDRTFSESQLEELNLRAIETFFDDLSDIFEQEHIVSTNNARNEAYYRFVHPRVDHIIHIASTDNYDRQYLADTLDSYLAAITVELAEMVTRYSKQDVAAYQARLDNVFDIRFTPLQ